MVIETFRSDSKKMTQIFCFQDLEPVRPKELFVFGTQLVLYKFV